MTPARVPGYWMYETSGVLRPAVEAYLKGQPITDAQIAAIRAYLRQWLEKGEWRLDGYDFALLYELVNLIESVEGIGAVLAEMDKFGMDPL